MISTVEKQENLWGKQIRKNRKTVIWDGVMGDFLFFQSFFKICFYNKNFGIVNMNL